jgi:hypothetical protein
LKERLDRREYGRKIKGRIPRFLLSYNLALILHREKKGLRERGGGKLLSLLQLMWIGGLEVQI